jgi:sugar phosphate isomerase/epimerase
MTLRFAYSSLPWKGQNLERNLGQLAAKGWQGWETRESLDELGTPKRILRVCADAGIEIAAVSGPNASDTCETPTHEICKRRIEFAADCGVALYMTKGPGHGDVQPSSDADLDRVAAVYEDLAEHGERLGVTVAWHPHVNHFVDSEGEWDRFLQRLRRVRLCLDMAHVVLWGFEPVQAARDHADRLAYVHLHDNLSRNNTAGDLGDGPMTDYVAFLRSLEEVGFDGWVVAVSGGTRDAIDSMEINRAYLHSVGY